MNFIQKLIMLNVVEEHEGHEQREEVQVNTACPATQTSVRVGSSVDEGWRDPVSRQTGCHIHTDSHGWLIGRCDGGSMSCGVTDSQGGQWLGELDGVHTVQGDDQDQ